MESESLAKHTEAQLAVGVYRQNQTDVRLAIK